MSYMDYSTPNTNYKNCFRNNFALKKLNSVEVECPSCRLKLKQWTLQTNKQRFFCSQTGKVITKPFCLHFLVLFLRAVLLLVLTCWTPGPTGTAATCVSMTSALCACRRSWRPPPRGATSVGRGSHWGCGGLVNTGNMEIVFHIVLFLFLQENFICVTLWYYFGQSDLRALSRN